MSASDTPTKPADPIRRLLGQNFYQRLGLTTNGVSHSEICQGYQKRLLKLERMRGQLPEPDLLGAIQLVEEAFRELSQSRTRRRYDAELIAAGGKATVADSRQLLMGRYELKQLLTEGARTMLYKAFDTHLKREVVIKQHRGEQEQTDLQRQAMQQQAETFARSNAGNLVKILDYDVQSGAIVLERLRADATSLLKPRGCNPQTVRGVLSDALRGLTSLHSRGIAHGRIQMEHLLVDDQGGVKLTLTPGMTGVETAIHPDSTVRHLAPELLIPKLYGDPGLAIDIYALGFLALELLCGKRFAKLVSEKLGGQSALEQQVRDWRHWHSSPTDHLPAIETLVPECSPDFCRVLQRMTSKQQHERFADAAECLAALNLQTEVQPPPVVVSETELLREEHPIHIMGTPPDLHPEYEAPSTISWRSIARDPRLLFRPESQSYLLAVVVSGLMLVGISLIVFQGGSNPTIAAKPLPAEPKLTWPEVSAASDSSVPGSSDPIESVAPTDVEVTRSVGLFVSPDGRVHAVDAADGQGPWKLTPGPHLASCSDASGERTCEIPFTVPQGQGDLVIYLTLPPSPEASIPTPPPADPESVEVIQEEPPRLALETSQEPDDPYADLAGMQFYPHVIPFEICCISSESTAKRQVEFLKQHFERLAIDLYRVDKTYFVKLSDKPIDPRATFLVAMQAYLLGDRTYAIECCRKSLNDARHFRVPFVLPLRLLIHLRLQSRHPGVALSECRQVLDWVHQESTDDPQDRFYQACDEVAWYLGNVIGFLDEAASPHTKKYLDLRHATDHLERTVRAEHWQKYRLARRDTHLQHAFLLRQGQALEAIAINSLSESVSASQSDSESLSQDDSLANVQWRDKDPRWAVAASLVSPQRYSSFQPCDISDLATTAAASIRWTPYFIH